MHATIETLADFLTPRLAQVEELFNRELLSDIPAVNTLVRHLARFRGKMLRPTLVLLSAKAAGEIRQEHIVIATVVEMVHMATLVHDDVLDEAELRRRGATINHLRGNEAAVLLGDYLISHSYHLCASLQSQSASRAIARTTNQVCEGELLQIENRDNHDLDEETYLEIIRRKTAVLCAACCGLAGEFASAPPAVSRKLETYGLCVGMAFQIQDDILDIVGDVRRVGKTLGIDVQKGKLTLPMIHFLRTAPHEHRTLLLSLLESDDVEKCEKIRNLILPSESIEYARAEARRLVDRAKSSLERLPDSDARRAMETMADFVVDRPM
jgi:octaprenyl-diphosphate synthase